MTFLLQNDHGINMHVEGAKLFIKALIERLKKKSN
jgi:hypothetical protein